MKLLFGDDCKKIFIISFVCLTSILTCKMQATALEKSNTRQLVVEVIKPVPRILEESISITGTCFSKKVSTLSSKISGAIQTVLVDEGQYVKKGQILVEIEDTDYQYNLELSQYQIESAQAQLEQGVMEINRSKADLATKKMDYDRIKEVYSRGSFPKQKMDHAKNDYETAFAHYNQAEISIKIIQNRIYSLETQKKIAQKKVSDCKIRAPFDAVITAKYIETGEWSNPGKPLFKVEQGDPIEIKGEVSEVYLSKVQLNMDVQVSFDGISKPCRSSENYCTMPLAEISPIIDPQTRTFTITTQIDNPRYLFKPGLFARMRLITKKAMHNLAIPQKCILDAKTSPKVMVVENKNARFQNIRTGIKQGELVEVMEGLDLNSIIIYNGLSQVKEGDNVKVIERKVQ